MESQRTFLFIGLLLVSFLLFTEWQKENNQPKADTSATQTVTSPSQTASNADVPTSSTGLPAQTTHVDRQVITVKTDVLAVKIDTKGGDIVEAKLLKHMEKHGSDVPYLLLGEFDGKQYVSQSGLVGLNGPDAAAQGRPVYTSDKSEYTLTGDELVVPLHFVDDKGVQFTKTFTFKANNYDVGVRYDVNNPTDAPIQVQLYTQIKRTVQDKGSMVDQTYLGATYGTSEEPYEKYSFKKMAEANLNKTTQGGYIAFIQHYFVSAWVPDQTTNNLIYSAVRNGQGIIGVKADPVNIAAGDNAALTAQYYMGPKDTKTLEAIHPDLHLTVDYGWLWFISLPLLSLLKFLYSVIGNWGVSIIAITIVVKSLLYPLTKAQYTSMAKMRMLQPKMQALKERFGDDRQKFGQAMMELYRKEQVNPMGGCFPLLLQMPIFLALFYVFLESTELRHAEFGLWLTDLSSKDPYFVLPILFGASMFLTQKLQPTTVTDPMQQKMMTWMPVIFSVFFLWFPSGLVLYWLVSNLISIAQMLFIYRGMEKKGLKVRG
ncbi:membrane protein insertase YidC [Pseudoalteromonas xiamenensis]|uniref:Membrane protein insertase YidC n=1 Tax=Pseudoalteromonas xiamenensis TaxID=882626 RepID=A0A975DEI8_9GAMM|nr:membrane protein insertase YidC [Pseudoalteromonas xiamenensis]QTH70363.1 membrane protein insertase YidC [Pseudoalteromonas xiamenensis]